jgi:hypothetical protein
LDIIVTPLGSPPQTSVAHVLPKASDAVEVELGIGTYYGDALGKGLSHQQLVE